MIRAENIFKSFGENEVLKGIDFVFEESKTNLIIGRSGAGKTVLLKILVGLYPPTQGKVWYKDKELYSLTKKQLRHLRMEVGMLFQGNALFDSMTIEENIRFPMDMFTEMTYKEKNMRVDEVLERVSMSGINNRFPSEISGGMQKRVGIARSIVLNPKYLFCDEPNSGLDPKTSITIDELISTITDDNKMTTIINTHDMNSVMEIGEKICLLHEGKLAWQGNNEEVLKSENQELHNFIFASPFLQKLVDRVGAKNI
ncbi:MAG: ATP-binding cassette domain-containing protein [Saprospiraceae bacterium]|nr:ATP-binding cassette domain-containing protein [Saprospiraceae bacterium]